MKECSIANSLAAKRQMNVVQSKESVSALRDSLEEQRVINHGLSMVNRELNKDIVNQKKINKQWLGENEKMTVDLESTIG